MNKTKIFYDILLEESKEKKYIKNYKLSINRVVMNSKEATKGDLFVAIRGGNNFVNEVLQQGAYVIYDNENIEINLDLKENAFLIKDSVLFLQKFAKKWRENLDIKIIGITGSNGKTTVKDIIFNLLSEKYSGKKTEGNYNNHIGLPFTLLRAEETDEFMILEMGMSNFGEIKLLGEIAQPDISVITNIGESHLEFLKTKENVFKAKTEILPYIKSTIVINGDDGYLKKINKVVNKFDNEIKMIKVLDFDMNEFKENTLNFYYGDILFNENNSKFKLKYFGQKCKQNLERNYETNLLGEHNILNEVLAIAVVKEIGMEDSVIEKVLKKIKLTGMRFERINIDNKIYINDAYNASPASMKKSLETFELLFNDREKIVVLGDMLELGDRELEYHEHLSKNLEYKSINKIYLYGIRMKALYEKLIEQKNEENFKNKEIIYFEDKENIIKKINEVKNKKAILIKASRGIKLEEIIK